MEQEAQLSDSSRAVGPDARCAIAVMAKAPSAGRTKTRLCPFLSPEEANDLGCCFLSDVTTNLAQAAREVPLDCYVAFAPAGREAAFSGLLEPGTRFVLADGSAPAPPGVDGLGRCLAQATDGLFSLGYAAVGLLNSDSPTLPTRLLVEAVRLLLQAQEIGVLGASSDGGYYFIGSKTPCPDLFRGIDWSTAHVAQQTRLRAGEIGLKLIDLEPWYDVDDVVSLRRLVDEIEGVDRNMPGVVGFAAPATAAWLRRSDLRRRFSASGESTSMAAGAA